VSGFGTGENGIMTVLIEPDELAAALRDPKPPRVLDVRWSLGGPPGLPLYRAGHIPGAVYVDLDTELAARPEPLEGRHPLPDDGALTEAARRWGLDDGDAVVVYDDLAAMSAARAWWLLRHGGVGDVRVLNGGLRAWRAAGHPLHEGDETAAPGNVTLHYGGMPTLTIDDVARLPGRGVLLDARAGERYRGEVEPIDPRAGHIPGAVSAPTTENVDADGRFLPPDALADRFRALGVRAGAPLGVYCGSGVTAAHEAIALEVAGFEALLYPGSYSQWSNHFGRPVALGD
jgi:Rhodanese-related sulfurtransferase